MHDIDLFPTVEINGLKMKDISRRFIIKWIESRHSKPYWFEYRIQGWKSIENVAYDFYGSCDYVWAVMVVNNIVHPIHDWLKTDEEVMDYTIKKYGATNIHSVHHYEYEGLKYTTKLKTLIDARNTKAQYGNVIPKDVYEEVVKYRINPLNKIMASDIQVVSNIEYELKLNEAKRFIKIIYPKLIANIEQEMETLF